MSSYFDYQSRKSRPREQIREELPAVAAERLLADTPMEVTEESLTDTAVMRIRRWIVGRER